MYKISDEVLQSQFNDNLSTLMMISQYLYMYAINELQNTRQYNSSDESC